MNIIIKTLGLAAGRVVDYIYVQSAAKELN